MTIETLNTWKRFTDIAAKREFAGWGMQKKSPAGPA